MTSSAALLSASFTDESVTGLPRPSRSPRRGVLDLSRNELVHPGLDALLGRLLSEIPATAASRYPIYSELVADLAVELNCRSDQLEVFPGSDDAIGVVIDALTRGSRTILLQEPNYPAYRHNAVLRGVHVLPWLCRPGHPLFAVADAVDAMTRLAPCPVIVTDPHGMLGTSLGAADLLTLAAAADVHGHLLVVDRCYQAFDGEHPDPLGPRDNVLRIGTLSKGAGLAGMRLGYVIGPAEIVDYLRRWRRAAAVSGPTAWIAVQLLRHHRHELASFVSDVANGRDWLAERVAAAGRGWLPLPSAANFITIDTAEPDAATALVRRLADHGVVVRSHRNDPAFASLVQITAAPAPILQQVAVHLGDEGGGAGDGGPRT